jgi:hypothetical protein
MISCHRSHLAARCRQRGYTLDEVRACIVSEDGDTITVDEMHEAYPREAKPGFVPPLPAPAHGPGTELSRLLERFGIKATPACKCRAVAARMDAWGCDECARPERIDEVIAVMREEAGKRGLPFLDAAGRMLVRRAISRARAIEREAENSRSQEG